jgi:MFS family permease
MVRGISMCGYLPWLTYLVPEPLRGRFISRDTMCMYVAVTGTMLLSSAWVAIFPSTRMYGILFLFSYAAAMGSLVFLRRIPDVGAPAGGKRTGHPPWKAMLLYPPFFRYIAFNVVMNMFVAGVGAIWVLYMRDSYGASGSLILVLSAYASIVAAGASLLTGPAADRFGSRPLLGFASGLIVIGQSLWMALAAGAIPHHAALLFGIVSFGAVGFAVLGVANTRLLMGLVPVMGRSHFFAIASVATSLTLGVLPIVWGLAFDGVARWIPDGIPLAAHWTWNRYSLIYGLIVAGLLVSQFFRHRLDEPRAMSTEEFMRILLVQSSARLISRVISPLRRLLPQG